MIQSSEGAYTVACHVRPFEFQNEIQVTINNRNGGGDYIKWNTNPDINFMNESNQKYLERLDRLSTTQALFSLQSMWSRTEKNRLMFISIG